VILRQRIWKLSVDVTDFWAARVCSCSAHRTEPGYRFASRVTSEYVYDALGNLRAVDLPDGTAIDYGIDGQVRGKWGEATRGASLSLLFAD
jgi:YD repeat-containing protein